MITYEWVVEQMDGDEIVDTSAFDTLVEARRYIGDENNHVISLRRDVGSEEEGLTDRQYAYAGAAEFEAGAAIPKRLMADFRALGNMA